MVAILTRDRDKFFEKWCLAVFVACSNENLWVAVTAKNSSVD